MTAARTKPLRVVAIATTAALTVSLGVIAGSAAEPVRRETSARVVVPTDKGRVEGVSEDGTSVFQGIPYAASPARWTLPRPHAAWAEVRDATRPGAKCAQLGAAGGLDPESSEDCLFLNVTTPTERRPAGGRPVIVWFHGGAWASGQGSEYDGRSLSRVGDAVVVTVNYRLGIFGFFGYPGLAGSGTFGLADQQAALRWVRRNAQAFGGDSSNVTIMGESSGGAAVCAQLVSPAAAGLFQRAVVQSGSCRQNWPRNVMVPDSEPIRYWAPNSELAVRGREAGRELGCADLACLRELDDAAALLGRNGDFTSPGYGTPILPVDPVRAVSAGAFHRVPVLQGNTHDEHRYFAQFAGDMDVPAYRANLVKSFGIAAKAVEQRYPAAAYPSPLLAWAAVGTDNSWVCPTLRTDRELARHTKVFSFSFDDPAAAVLEGSFPPGFPSGAYHASEVGYLFDFGPYAPMTPAQQRLAEQMRRYWTNFARSGDPNGPGLPRWPAYQGGATTQSLAPGAVGQVDAGREHQCAFWQRST